MSALPAQTIRALCPILPFHERKRAHGMTYGLSAAGYDVRIAEDLWLWPGRYVLASTVEMFCMPSSVLARVCDKSTWARRGVTVQNTIIEPGWRGYLTLELEKKWSRPFVVRLRAGMPIAQIIFERLEAPTDQPYDGKYQDQPSGAQPAILEKWF